MSLFNKLNTNQKAMEEKTDRLGGGNSPLESGLYKAKIAVAYGTESKSGAMGVVVKFDIFQEGQDKPRPLTQTLWISNKNGDTFYLDKDGNPHNLAGFNHANQLCAMVTGKSIFEASSEEKQVMLYNFEQKKEVLTTVPALVDLIDAEVVLGIKKIRKNKQEAGSDGKYVDTADEQIINEIDKIFIEKDGQVFTHDELRAEAEEGLFAQKWTEKWTDVTDDKYKEVKGAKSSSAGTTRKLGIG